jgi:hypothetical protein
MGGAVEGVNQGRKGKKKKMGSPNWTMEHHLKRMLDEKINDLGLQLLSPAEEHDSWHR